MAGFRDRRIMLLIFLALICGGLIFGMRPQWGVDITGGSRIYLRLEASWVTLNFTETPSNEEINNLIEGLEEGLNTSVVSLVSYEDVKTHNQIVLEIGKIVTENMISPLIGGGIEIQDPIEEKISDHTREEVINSLYTRVDPYGTLGAQFKSVEEKNYVLFEVSLPLEDAEKLLSHRGRLEIFIENELVLRGEHLKDVSSPSYSREREGYEVPFELTDDGVERFADASENKGGYPGVIYLDRPDDAILIFGEEFTDQISTDAGPDVGGAEYDENARRFRFRTLGNGEAHWFYIQVNAVETQTDNIPLETLEYLQAQQGIKKGVIFLGELDDLSENMIQGENLVWDNEALFPIEEETKLGGEFTTEWLARVSGAESWPIISEEIAGNEERIKTGMVITTGTEKHASDLYIILSQRLPVEISIESESWIEPRLGEEFLEEAAKAGLIAFLAVGALVYLRYRRFKIAIPLMITMACEIIIPLGVASAFHGFITFGIAEIGALIVVVGTGVDHQIIISDEVLVGVSPSRKIPIKRRVSRAFTIIFAAAATTIAAMVMLAFLGFGAMRGFAIITTLGILISVLITRPAYARIIGALLERESQGEAL
jgi:preprotein translocase subunit SecD